MNNYVIRTDEQEDEFWEDILEQYEEAYMFTCRVYGLPDDEYGIAKVAMAHNWNQEQLIYWVHYIWQPHMINLLALRRDYYEFPQ